MGENNTEQIKSVNLDLDEMNLLIDSLHKAIAVCDWDSYDEENYESPKAQKSWLYSLVEKFEKELKD